MPLEHDELSEQWRRFCADTGVDDRVVDLELEDTYLEARAYEEIRDAARRPLSAQLENRAAALMLASAVDYHPDWEYDDGGEYVSGVAVTFGVNAADAIAQALAESLRPRAAARTQLVRASRARHTRGRGRGRARGPRCAVRRRTRAVARAPGRRADPEPPGAAEASGGRP